MLKTHLDNSARAKKIVHRLSMRHLAQMKQLAAYSYREEPEPEKVKFPLVGILDRYYDSRRLAAIAGIIAYSIPAHCLNSGKYRIFMTAADSTANIPLTFKVWDDTPEEKPKLLCVCVAAVMPLLESGRKKGAADHIAWTFRENPEDTANAVDLPERGMGTPVAYPVPDGNGAICVQIPEGAFLHAAPGQSCTMVYMARPQRRSLPLLPCLPPCRTSPPLSTGRKTGTIRPRQPVQGYPAGNRPYPDKKPF